MSSQHTINEMVKFFIHSFKPNYTIHLTSKNKITNFDKQLIHDFPTSIKDSEDYIGQDLVNLIANSTKYSSDFADILSGILNNHATGLCAINTSFKDGVMDIPAIYILFILVEINIVNGNQVKELKIFNYIEIVRFLSCTLNENMFKLLIRLNLTLKDAIREKSIFFAFEALKYFGTFMSSDMAAKINQYQLADVVFPFHRAKTREVTQRFVNEFLRSSGYIEYDKNRQIKELSLDTLKRVANKNLIPFNSLDANYIIRIT